MKITLLVLGFLLGIYVQSFIGWYKFEHEKHIVVKGIEYECEVLR